MSFKLEPILIFIPCMYLSVASGAADQLCMSTGQVTANIGDTQMWVELTKKMAIESADKDLKGFCEWNRMDRATGGGFGHMDKQTQLAAYRAAKSEGNLDKASDTFAEGAGAGDPWTASMLGHPKLKSGKRTIRSWFQTACPTGPSECATHLAAELSQSGFSTNFKVPDYTSTGPLNVSKTQTFGACVYLSNPLTAFECYHAADEVLKFSEIHVQGDDLSWPIKVTGVPLIRETMSDPRITHALQLTASKLWKKIGGSNFSSGDNIFSDLSDELQRDGFSSENARKEALKILGTIAAGGPNLSVHINSNDVQGFPKSCSPPASCNLNGVMMSAIAEGLAQADTITMRKNLPSLYSLPAGTDFPCDIGKSYHFWMSAALTSRLMEEGYSASAARAAVFASHLGYQLQGIGMRSRDVINTARFGSIENGIRMDINYAAAGSSFGSDASSAKSKLQLKQGLLSAMNGSNINPATPADFNKTPSQVIEWMNRTGAKSSFDFYN